MRSTPYIIASRTLQSKKLIGIGALVLLLTTVHNGQRLAVVAPSGTVLDNRVATEVVSSLVETARVQDLEMSRTAFRSVTLEDPFNMTSEDARRVGSVIGCNFYMLVRTRTQRRAALENSDYFEATATIFTVSSRTGRLVDWRLLSENSSIASDAEDKLSKSVPPSAIEILKKIRIVQAEEANSPISPVIEEPPDPASPAAKNFRPPVPYRRTKPEYTRTAYLYDITATVEATVDLDDKGQITRLEITRWGGYELDESVIKAIRSMNWRPAERNGKPLPIRFLLRYNFKKIDKDDLDNE